MSVHKIAKSELINCLEEQIAVEFTGRINLVTKENGQLVGKILLFEGAIVEVDYEKGEGFKALFHACLDNLQKNNLRYLVEPEIVSERPAMLDIPSEKLINKLVEQLAISQESDKLRPPGHLKLKVNINFVEKGADIEPDEFDVLCLLSEFNKVDDLYRESELLPNELTNTLVSLRKKGALIVFE